MIGPRRPGEADAGYALIAAVAAIVIFALLAMVGVSAMRAAIVTGSGEVDAAKVGAAADAGIALAINHLLSGNDTQRWSIDGRPYRLGFAGARLTIRVVDERGKVPINIIEDEQVTAMLEAVGLSGQALRIARDSFLDWRDDDDEPRLDGAETSYYLRRGINPRNGALTTISEMALIRGFTPDLVERLRPFITVNFGAGAFEPRYGQPIAINIMFGKGSDGAAAIIRQRELDGDRTAFDFNTVGSIIGRPLSIIADAELPSGARAQRTAIIELTGTSTRPYVVRSYL